ncbi:acyltransferase family protein [Actinokineospora iranica]|uniref:Peptidoglycan/LPS O-acetylase OafA/YrhL, contains acyltransferase and SGNH-hydrolase domains n=1 Tax=Actinokineospora iranica TaxID=1271860 RepID=A0A1G6W8R1_9PSEU|nr:acyltransferase [Actinokineospora iranica]SDD62211.1 Peptidoglycan/LPS O-acetylase OafA/YrhL, contains acyltransferase and SGNH-hydrolase domains [Actinokineospora iranica]
MTDSTGTRLPSLTGLRFVAAGMVFGFHASIEGVFADPGTSAAVGQAFSRAGFFGVEFFFVLSGFILTWTARRDDTRRGFWGRRARKIYPNHVVTWAVAILLALWAGQAVGWQVLPNLLLVHAWAPVPEVLNSANIVAWSLACEVLFYALFPVLHAGIRRIRVDRLWWWAGGVVALVFTMPLIAQSLPADPQVPTPGGPMSFYAIWFVYLFPPTRVLEFVLGMFVARIVRDGRWTPPSLGVAGLVAGLAYLAAFTVPYLYCKVAIALVPLALVIASAAAADARGAFSPFRSRGMVWLGEISFAFYLLHWLVLVHGHRLLGTTWGLLGGAAVLALALAVTVLLSWALHVTVERPLTRPKQHTDLPAR